MHVVRRPARHSENPLKSYCPAIMALKPHLNLIPFITHLYHTGILTHVDNKGLTKGIG